MGTEWHGIALYFTVPDHPLQPAHHVGEHRRPGELPDRGAQRTVHDGAVVASADGRRHGRRGGRRDRNGCGGAGLVQGVPATISQNQGVEEMGVVKLVTA